jgi:hypothetical protein
VKFFPRWLVFCVLMSGCDPGERPAAQQEQKSPFTVVEQNGRLIYALRLPDCGNLLVMANATDGAPVVTGASISSAEGIMYSTDFSRGESVIFDPETRTELVYSSTEEGLKLAPEADQEKYREISRLFADHFGKHVGSHGDAGEAMEDLEKLRQRLKELEWKE